MKKLISTFMAIIMLISLSACSDNQHITDQINENSSNTQSTTNETATSTTEEISPETSTTEDIMDWGWQEIMSAENNNQSCLFSVNFPYGNGMAEGYAITGDWSHHGAGMMLSCQNENSPTINNAAELLPAYLDQIQYNFEEFYGLRASNFEISADKDVSSTTINNYKMYIFTGNISFDYYWHDDITLKKDFPFIVYATTLKTNGAYVYWLVYDCSDDHSKGDLIAEHALNMAKTFQENPRLI